MEKLIVDRIEDGLAVCETEALTHVTIALSLLPNTVKEGSVLIKNGDNYVTDCESTDARRREIAKKQSSIFKKHK